MKMKKKYVKVAFIAAIVMLAGINVFNSIKSYGWINTTMMDLEALALDESIASGTRCLGESDCYGKVMYGKCYVKSTNNAAIVMCEEQYVVLGDCCGIENIIKEW